MIANMGWERSIILFCFLFAIVNTIKVDLYEEWKPEIGWEATCKWNLDNLPLLNLLIKVNGEHLAYYSPSNGVPKKMHKWSMPEYNIVLQCEEAAKKCTLTIQPVVPPAKPLEIFCEGRERAPSLNVDSKTIRINTFVPPSDATIFVTKPPDQSHPVLNCSAAGIPAPNLMWTIGNEQTKVQANYHSVPVWNSTSKLWHVWSTLVRSSDQRLNLITCTPIAESDDQVFAGNPAEYKSVDQNGVGLVFVDIIDEWVPELGWQVTCAWSFTAGDKLLSVSLHKDDQQFMLYRPYNNGPSVTHAWSLLEYFMKIECIEDLQKCVFTVEPVQPPKNDFSFGCEVSGERPMFRMASKKKLIKAFVPPTPAELNVSKLTEQSNPVLNCTSEGVPAPNLIWTVGDEKIKVPENFRSSRMWNATSKLWHVWSTFVPSAEQIPDVRCTPIVLKDGQTYSGQTVEYNSAVRVALGHIGTKLIPTIALLFLM